MIDWIRTWTFFNWLAIIAFVFSCISVLNAIFGLRSRYKDARATRSKKAFDKRLSQLKEHFATVRALQKSTTYLLAELGFRLFGVLFLLVMAVGYIVVMGIDITLAEGKIKGTFIFDSIYFFVLITIGVIVSAKSMTLMTQVSHPRVLGEKAIKLINRGKQKGYLPQDDTTADYFIESDMFSNVSKEYLRALLDKS